MASRTQKAPSQRQSKDCPYPFPDMTQYVRTLTRSSLLRTVFFDHAERQAVRFRSLLSCTYILSFSSKKCTNSTHSPRPKKLRAHSSPDPSCARNPNPKPRRISKRISRDFAKSFPQKIAFAKSRPLCIAFSRSFHFGKLCASHRGA